MNKDYHSDGLSYDEFEAKALLDIKRLDNIEEMRNAFIALDFSCKGFLTIDDLIKQFHIVAPHMSRKKIIDIFRFNFIIIKKISYVFNWILFYSGSWTEMEMKECLTKTLKLQSK